MQGRGKLSGIVAHVTWLAVLGHLFGQVVSIGAPEVAGPSHPEAAANSTPSSESSAEGADVASAESDADPYLEQAPLDVDTILHDSSKAYLQARARLVEHPELAAEALLDRLAAVPPPGPAGRKRLMDVLSELGQAEHLELFATELRRGVKRAGSLSRGHKEADRWRPLLRDGGPDAVGVFTTLVGDKDLPLSIRADLLEDLVVVTPTSDLANLVVLVGRGHRELGRRLSDALTRRAKKDAEARRELIRSLDAALDDVQPEALEAERLRVAALLRSRSRVTGGSDSKFTRRLDALAGDENAPFAVRVAALRGLARLDDPASIGALGELAASLLTQKNTQAGEILARLALDPLPPAQLVPLVQRFELLQDPAPRLALVAHQVAPVETQPGWVEQTLEHPWPEVRRTGLDRIEGPCDRDVSRALREAAGPTDKGGDSDRVVARAAVRALGRCGPSAVKDLSKLLGDDRVDIEQRAEAARQLVRHGGPEGIDRVAEELRDYADRPLSRRLATALGYAPHPTPAATQALCAELDADADYEVMQAARKSLMALHDDPASACQAAP